jgi:MFS family permease
MAAVPRVALLALAVGLVLADSSVVTLGLPDVLADFDATPARVAWVLTGYNLVLAAAALPAAALARSAGPVTLVRGGLVVFALASLACALAPSLGALVVARCVQGLGGAAVAVGALPLLADATGSRARGTTVWAVAGAIGAAVGPAAGGLLTEALAWEAIFAVQVPLAVACLAAAAAGPALASAAGDDPLGARADRPAVPALLALAALGAGLTAALFLLVLLLIAGWRESPLTAALTVTVMPIAALLASRVGRGLDERARGAAGAVLVAGGLAALGLLPEAGLGWTIAPQVLIGLGLGLGLDALTEAAVRDRAPLATHGGWTIAARHAGIVVALAVLTPLFSGDLAREEERAEERGLALVLDAPIAPATKLTLGLELAERIDRDEGRVPEVGPAFAAAPPSDPAEAPAYARLEARLNEELDRAATAAFSRSFLIGALLAALAAVPLLLRVRT